MLSFPILNPRKRRDGRRKKPAPVADVLVLSVVALPDGSARMTFSAAVTLSGGDAGETIHFVVEDRDGYAHELTQAGPDSIVAAVDGLPIASGATWEVLSVPACFELPAGAGMPVPQ